MKYLTLSILLVSTSTATVITNRQACGADDCGKVAEFQGLINPESDIHLPAPIITDKKACGQEDCGKDPK